jgi:hypothetical protein
MSCTNVQELISSLLDLRGSASDRQIVLAHVGSCRKCSAYLEATRAQRIDLRNMAHTRLPAGLHERLRVVASHERERQLARVSVSTRLKRWVAAGELTFDNLMRPLAVPFAGGLLSALLLFSALVPTLSFHHNFTDEAFFTYPVGSVVQQVGGSMMKPLSDAPRIASSDDSNIPADANVVELTIDENGRVSDYRVDRGQMTPDVQSIIMFSQFMPATNLGVPVSAKVKVVQSHNRNMRS